MSDPSFTDEFFKDSSLGIKLEPSSTDDLNLMNVSGCMPIPSRRLDLSQIRDCSLVEFGDVSPLIQDHEKYADLNTNDLWSSRINGDDVEFTKMEDDDIFQVDKSDLIQDTSLPTLADLHHPNRGDLLEDLNFDELLLPNEFCVINVPNLPRTLSPPIHQLVSCATPANSFDSTYSPFLAENVSLSLYRDSSLESPSPSSPLNIITSNTKTYMSLESSSNLNSPSLNSPTLLSPSNSSSTPQKPSSLHELLMKKDPHLLSPGSSGGASSNVLGQSVPGPSLLQTAVSRSSAVRTSPSSRLSSSAPTHLDHEQIWQRREPRQHLLSTGSLVEAGSASSLSTGGILSPADPNDFSLDEEGCDSEYDSEQYDYDSSDADSGSDGEGGSSTKISKKERYFWQYNVQSKGPKGQRLVLKTQMEDPHCLNEITDPVFSPDCSLQGIKHSGKARKGDGNDLTPNPKKLHTIGKELDKLNRVINDMTPVSELPFNVRPHTRKEKNKLASRACRLKKKAQHEANKIKLLGLEQEHKRLITCIHQLKQMIAARIVPGVGVDGTESMKNVDKMVRQATKFKVAGQSTEFVNKILDKIRSGVPHGGLDELSSFH